MRSRTGFTLAEVVILLAVIVVLAAILWPVWHTKGDDMVRYDCQSHLKEVLLGTMQYAQDYDRRFPLLNARYLRRTVPPSTGYICSLQPYVKSFQIFQCPAEARHKLGNTDYSYNASVLAGLEDVMVKNAANTVIYADSNEAPGALAAASAPTVLNRHWDGSDYAFADGHVEWLVSDKAPSPSNVPATGANFTFGK